MAKIGDTRPDPLLRPARQDEVAALLRDGIGCRTVSRKGRR